MQGKTHNTTWVGTKPAGQKRGRETGRERDGTFYSSFKPSVFPVAKGLVVLRGQ